VALDEAPHARHEDAEAVTLAQREPQLVVAHAVAEPASELARDVALHRASQGTEPNAALHVQVPGDGTGLPSLELADDRHELAAEGVEFPSVERPRRRLQHTCPMKVLAVHQSHLLLRRGLGCSRLRFVFQCQLLGHSLCQCFLQAGITVLLSEFSQQTNPTEPSRSNSEMANPA
jgi:hypothetical protein